MHVQAPPCLSRPMSCSSDNAAQAARALRKRIYWDHGCFPPTRFMEPDRSYEPRAPATAMAKCKKQTSRSPKTQPLRHQQLADGVRTTQADWDKLPISKRHCSSTPSPKEEKKTPSSICKLAHRRIGRLHIYTYIPRHLLRAIKLDNLRWLVWMQAESDAVIDAGVGMKP